MALIAAGVVLSLFFVDVSAIEVQRSIWFNVLVFLFAVGIPFAVTLAWWKYTKGLAGRRLPRIPRDEIYITHNDLGLLIGYPKAIAQYGWQDISRFYVGDRFIGFRPDDGLIHVIANHAFGGRQGAVEFLLTAERLRSQYELESNTTTADIQSVQETGNPYQPPAWTK